MIHHKKYFCGLAAIAIAVSAVHAAPPQLTVNNNVSQGQKPAPDEPMVRGGDMPLAGSFTSLYVTGFEGSDGWDLSKSICGNEFSTCVGNVSVGNVCVVKNHVGNGNCCDKDPNVDTGWFYNGLARHCNQPHIDNVHPSPLKSASSQHLRMQYDPAGGSPAGCTGFGSGCRQRWSAPWDRGQKNVNKTTWKYDISFSHGFIGTSTRIRNFFGNIVNGGGIFVHAYVYFHSNGYVYVINPSTGAVLSAIGKWSYDSPDYAQVKVEYDPCNNKINYNYSGKPNILYPTGSGTYSQSFGFSPPYGDYCNYSGANCAGGGTDPRPAYLDSMTWSQSHFNDGQKIDMDNFSLTHEECPSACCDNTTGICTDITKPDTCPFKNFYPNVSCAQLGTPGFPPRCGVARGSCCDAGPRTGGACTDGVLEADCIGAQLTWTKGASCDGFVSLCHIGDGMCNSGPGLDPTKAPWHCINGGTDGQLTPCTTNADCAVDGFCYGGHCSPAAIPGHCEYVSAGFCQNMGQCAGGPPCVANDGTPGGCCDTTCTTPVNCPGGAACQPLKQTCNNVPGGADCAFCEGCDPWPTVGCSNIGSSASCPSPAAGIPAGICVPNATYVCNGDTDCPVPQSGGLCIFPAVSPGGILCRSHAECNIPATACEEHTGACCNAVKGVCDDDVLEADCKGVQDTWTKLGVCADIEAAGGCEADLGACCDHDTFGGCYNTTFNGCPTTGTKNEWTKNVLCENLTVPCSHIAIPTVSEWGIVVLTLLLLVGAKVYFGRRQAATA